MGRKPPSHLYGHSITLRVCTGVDTFQNPTWREYAVTGVNVQESTGTVVTAANTDASRRSLMFVDSLYTAMEKDAAQARERGRRQAYAGRAQG